jgi:SAM-dependent methyltransferase
MTLPDRLSQYFSNTQSSEGLTEPAAYHYNAKIHYLSDPAKIANTWHSTMYLLNRSGFSPANKTILDLGAGTGYLSIYFAVEGARKVVALEPRLTKIDAMQRYLDHMPEEISSKVIPDARRLDELGDGEKYDLIFAQEVISHINDDQLQERLMSLLNPGGTLYITDFNNELYSPYRKEMSHHWAHFEAGPAGIAGHHTVELPYEQHRQDLFTEWHPETSTADAKLFAANSAYMWGEDLKSAARQFVESGKHPESPYIPDTPPIQPVHGYLMEKQFNALKMKTELLGMGYSSVRIYNTVGFDRPGWMRFLLRLIPVQIKLRLRPGFMLIATKPGG